MEIPDDRGEKGTSLLVPRSSFSVQRSSAIVLPSLTALAILAIWWAAVVATGTKIFPSPLDVARALVQLARDRLLWVYVADSVVRVLWGFGAAVLIGIPAGILFGWYSWLGDAVNPLIQMLRPISPLAWMPLAVIWFGIGDAAPVFLIFLASLFPILLAGMNAVHNIPPVFLDAGRNFGLRPAQLLRRVVLPAVLPRVVVGMRIAFGVAWLVLVAAEMIAVDSGLGYLILDARNAGQRYDLVVSGMLLIGVVGLILDTLLRRIELLPLVRWSREEVTK